MSNEVERLLDEFQQASIKYGECPIDMIDEAEREMISARGFLLAEVEALRADAERYRWLRDHGVPNLCVAIDGEPSYRHEDRGKFLSMRIDVELAAIDNARK